MMARNLQFEVYLGLWGIMNTTFFIKSAKGYSRLVSVPTKDWTRFWFYHQNNQPGFLENQVHFVPYPFHTRIMPCRTHPPSPPFVDIQVYSTSSSSSSSSDSDSDDWKRKQVLACSSCPTGLMKYYIDMCICISIIYIYIILYLYLYLNNVIFVFNYIYIYIHVSPYDKVRIKTLADNSLFHTSGSPRNDPYPFLSHTHIYIYILYRRTSVISSQQLLSHSLSG